YGRYGLSVATQTISMIAGNNDNLFGYDSNNKGGIAYLMLDTLNSPVSSIKVRLKKVGNPTQNIVMKIYEDLSGGFLTGLVATATNTISYSSINTSYQTFTFNFNKLNQSGWKYIKIEMTSDVQSTTNYFSIDFNSNTSLTGGILRFYSSAPGGQVSQTVNYKGCYEINTIGYSEDTSKIYTATDYLLENKPIGIIESSKNTGEDVKLICSGLKSGFAGLTPYSKYYLNSAGVINTTVSGVPVGRALSSSVMRISDNLTN
ncbi:MAG TPA: hypothetical protein PLQ36_03740, partial [Candidatus Gracilibacteria bacterium]|nr:hypothetical protein [Candidatus Gracilibacteria bacterium]